MKSIKFLTIGLLIAGASIFSSCKKEGCTDPDSSTYNADAKKDDGTCLYEGEVVFWYNQTASDNLYNYGSDALTFYVDGNVVGSTNTSVYWSSSPDCGDNGSITVTKDLGNVKTQSYSYSVVDDLGEEIWSGTVNFNANTCTSLELIF